MTIKFLKGGIAIPPLVSYLPVMLSSDGTAGAAAGEAISSSSKSSGSESDLTDKDLLKMMEKLEGLPNDMLAVTSLLQGFYIDLQYSPFPNTTNIASRYLLALLLMRTANFNRKLYDDAYETISKNGGINELAINEKGLLICANEKGDFIYLRPELLGQAEGYRPVTNAELLRLRAYSPELANNNSILGVVANGIGIKLVTDYIQGLIGKLGTTEKNELGYINTPLGQIISGLLAFQSAVSKAALNGIKFDGTTLDLYHYKLIDKNQKDQADAALNYVYSLLPENAKTLLKTRTNSGTDLDAQKLIATIIASQLDYTNTYDIELKAGKTVSSAKKQSTSDDTDLKTSLPLLVLNGQGGTEKSTWLDIGNGIQMHVKGEWYQTMTNKNHEPIMDTSMAEMLASSGLLDIIKDRNIITYGDQKITMELLRNITYNNTGVVRANLPIHPDGSINLDVLAEYQQAEAEVELLGNEATPDKIKTIFENHGISDLIDEKGQPIEEKFGPFILAEGYTTEQNGIKDSDFVKNKTKEVTDEDLELIKRSLTVGEGKKAVSPSIDTSEWWNPMDWFGNYDNIYKATIFIPITTNKLAAVRGARQSLDTDEAKTLEKQYQDREKILREQNNSADILGL